MRRSPSPISHAWLTGCLLLALAACSPGAASPNLSALANTPGSIWDGSSCGPTAATVTVAAADATGVPQVALHDHVVKGSEQGTWRVLTMASAGGNTYSKALGPMELSASLSIYGGGTVEYWVKATDGRGNTAQTTTAALATQLCFG